MPIKVYSYSWKRAMTYVIMAEAGCTEVTKASNTREQVYCFTDENHLSECVVTALFTTIIHHKKILKKLFTTILFY